MDTPPGPVAAAEGVALADGLALAEALEDALADGLAEALAASTRARAAISCVPALPARLVPAVLPRAPDFLVGRGGRGWADGDGVGDGAGRGGSALRGRGLVRRHQQHLAEQQLGGLADQVDHPLRCPAPGTATR